MTCKTRYTLYARLNRSLILSASPLARLEAAVCGPGKRLLPRSRLGTQPARPPCRAGAKRTASSRNERRARPLPPPHPRPIGAGSGTPRNSTRPKGTIDMSLFIGCIRLLVVLLLAGVIVAVGWREPLRYRFMSPLDIAMEEHAMFPPPPPPPTRAMAQNGIPAGLRSTGRRIGKLRDGTHL